MAGEKSWAEQSWAERIGGVIGVLLALIGMGWGIWWCAGCGKNGDPQQPPAPQKSKFDLEPSPKSETPDAPEASGPLVDARERAKRFEKKRAALQPLLDKALTDRDELVGKLREAGVEKPDDLKGNSRGQQLAAALQRLTGEIDGLEQQHRRHRQGHRRGALGCPSPGAGEGGHQRRGDAEAGRATA